MKKSVIISLISTLLIISQSFGPVKSHTRQATDPGFSGISGNQQEKKETAAKTAMKTVYTCPMHPEVVMDKEGKCPKCGMNLVKKEVPKEIYTCPMHSEVVQDKPGKCPKCGMTLVKKENVIKETPVKK